MANNDQNKIFSEKKVKAGRLGREKRNENIQKFKTEEASSIRSSVSSKVDISSKTENSSKGK